MKLKQYLTEGKPVEILDADIEPFLKKNCKPILNLYKSVNNKFLWRGIRGMGHVRTGILNVRQNRQSMNTNADVHRILNKLTKEMFGWKMRSEGLFTTTSKFEAIRYNAPYMIFPIGNFKFLYHPGWYDSFVNVKMTGGDTSIAKKEGNLEDVVREKWLEADGGWTDKNLKAAFNKETTGGTEVIIKCKKYVAIHQGLEERIREML